MRRIVVTAGLACALVAPAVVIAQTGSATSPATTKAQGATKAKGATETGQATSPSGLTGADKRFVLEAASGGMAEVELGRLAADKAANADVKQFGQRMVDDHSKANDELKSLASSKNVTLPSDLSAAHKAMRDRLAKLSGDAFDRAYMREMVADHNKDVAAFQRQSKMAKDTDLKAFAEKTLPTLQEHQKMAKEINAKVGVAATTGQKGTKKK